MLSGGRFSLLSNNTPRERDYLVLTLIRKYLCFPRSTARVFSRGLRSGAQWKV